jgi:hypothetical protein
MSSEAQQQRSSGPGRIGVARIVVGLAGLVVLFGPVVAWVLGARATVSENRPFAARPTWSQGWEMSDQFTAFFTDRLPIRADAIDLRRTLSENVFDEPPAAGASGGPVGAGSGASGGTQYERDRAQQVLRGRDGWLYYGDDLVRACRPQQGLDQATAQLRRLVLALRAAGKRAVVVVMPDKSTIETAYLPDDLPERTCAADARRARYAALRGLGLPEVLDMRGELERLRARLGQPVYVPLDTHVTTRASAEYVRAVVRRLDPQAARTATLERRREPFEYVGDLSVIEGDPQEVVEPTLRFEKPGLRRRPAEDAQPLKGYFVTRQRARGTARAPVVAGRTVWYGDSFTQRALPNIGTFFRDVWRVPELSDPAVVSGLDQGVDVLLSQIRDAENVVLETVERNALGRVDGSILNPRAVERIVAGLRRDPGVRADR